MIKERGHMLIVLIGALLVAFLLSIFLTPYVGKLAFKLGATDQPNRERYTVKSCRVWAD